MSVKFIELYQPLENKAIRYYTYVFKNPKTTFDS